MKFQMSPELIETMINTPEQGIADLTRTLNEGNYTELSLRGALLDYSDEEIQILLWNICRCY